MCNGSIRMKRESEQRKKKIFERKMDEIFSNLDFLKVNL